jgi:hypothetical protein
MHRGEEGRLRSERGTHHGHPVAARREPINRGEEHLQRRLVRGWPLCDAAEPPDGQRVCAMLREQRRTIPIHAPTRTGQHQHPGSTWPLRGHMELVAPVEQLSRRDLE